MTGNDTFGLNAQSAAVVQVDNVIFYEETADCLPQGTNYFWLVPFNGVVPGPESGPFSVDID